MSTVYECQNCKVLHSALTPAGICINCDTKQREEKIAENKLKMLIFENEGNTQIIEKLTGLPAEKIEELKKKIQFKEREAVFYQCTRCGQNTEILVSRLGHSGVCPKCADKLQKIKENPDRYKEPKIGFTATNETPRFDKPNKKNKTRKG